MAIQNDWTSYIAYGRFKRPSKSNLVRIGTSMDILWHGVKTRLFDKHGFGSKHATRKLITKIKGIKPDIIHLHHLHGYYVNIKILFQYLSEASIPVVWTFHDCWSLTGHCAYFDFVGCEKWQTECNRCPNRKEYPKSLFIDRSRENFQTKRRLFTSVKNMTIVTVSDWLKNLVGSSFMINIPTITIHNGVDNKIFEPQTNINEIKERYKLNERFVILGVASPWINRKGLNDFLRLSNFLFSDEVILLVGLNQAQIKYLPYNIIGLSRTENQRKLAELYSAADIFINPTWEDNFPTTNIESLSCGTPVATYRTGGSVEAVSYATGFVVEKGDIEGLLNCIRTVKKNGKQAYSDACRLRAITTYSKDNQYGEYLRLYKRLMESKS